MSRAAPVGDRAVVEHGHALGRHALADAAAEGAAALAVEVAFQAVAHGLFGALVELTVLRRVYRLPELFQLLATFGVVLLTPKKPANKSLGEVPDNVESFWVISPPI